MLHFISDAPYGLVRDIMVMAKGFVEPAGNDQPLWVDSIVHVHENDAMAVLYALRDYRVGPRQPARVAIADPTFALAAAAIERGNNSSPSSASYASR